MLTVGAAVVSVALVPSVAHAKTVSRHCGTVRVEGMSYTVSESRDAHLPSPACASGTTALRRYIHEIEQHPIKFLKQLRGRPGTLEHSQSEGRFWTCGLSEAGTGAIGAVCETGDHRRSVGTYSRFGKLAI